MQTNNIVGETHFQLIGKDSICRWTSLGIFADGTVEGVEAKKNARKYAKECRKIASVVETKLIALSYHCPADVVRR